jgi:hypothetical protein
MPPGPTERQTWANACALILAAVGASTFDIWLATVELVAVDPEGLLVLAGPEVTSRWVPNRFGQLISQACEQMGRGARFASPRERAAINNRPQARLGAVVHEHPTTNRRLL